METLSYKKEFKAVKNHVCDFCGDRISVGERYNKSTHKYEGEIYDWKTHLHCDYLADKLKMYDEADAEGLTAEGFQEILAEEYFAILRALFTEDECKKFTDVIQQLRYVRFRDKLFFVLRHYKKRDEISNLPTK